MFRFQREVSAWLTGSARKPARRAIHIVTTHAKTTTETELAGIRIAHTIGASRPAAAMLTPATL